MHTTEDSLMLIRHSLTQTLHPLVLIINDDSHLHIGHSSAKGGGHFSIQITSAAFAGKTPVQRHQMVYQALEDLMKTDIHAISITAKAPNEQ
jgi:BolA protein